MIPDELIEKALYAYDTAAGPPYSSTDGMRAALEAVAADIWDEATSAQAEWEWLAERGREGNRPNPQDANPYRASETA